jgi:hypothetical protein
MSATAILGPERPLAPSRRAPRPAAASRALPPPPPPCEPAAAAVPRRAALFSLAAASAAALAARPATAAAAAQPSGEEIRTLTSRDGFAFDYPASWVVAFDRSGGFRGEGAVATVGDFRGVEKSFLVVAAFRQAPPRGTTVGGAAAAGRALNVDAPRADAATLRFAELRSEGTPDGGYEFEFEVEACGGEVLEGAGGRVRCLGPGGAGELPTVTRHHVGRCVAAAGAIFTLTAAVPADRWPAAEAALRAVVGSLRAVAPA